jgi:hypothetical protein
MYSTAQDEHDNSVLVGNPGGKNNWEDLEVGGRIILKWTLRNLNGGILLVYDWNQWRAFVNKVMNIRFP